MRRVGALYGGTPSMALKILVAFALVASLLACAPAAEAPAVKLKKSAGDDLFADSPVRRLRIEIADEGMATLRKYHFRRNAIMNERVAVSATVREGNKTYTKVAVHLKGG